MGITLTGKRIKDTYDGLIKTTDNKPLNSSKTSRLNDGVGNPCPIYLSQTSVEINNGTLGIMGGLLDGGGSAGTSGQILSSTGTGVDWISGGGISYIESVTHHNFNIGSSPSDIYVPINTTVETTSRNVENFILPIYSGQIGRILISTSNTTTGNRLFMYNGATLIGNTATFATTANTPTSLSLDVSTFNVGNRINFRLTSDTTIGDVQLSILWQYTRPV